MKTLILVRHAKSGLDSPTYKDFDRTLSDRGEKDAPVMARRLLERGISLDAFVSSPAARALQTARHFLSIYKSSPEKLIQIPELYHPAVASFYNAITGFENQWNAVAIFSHNPGISEMVNSLQVAHVSDMPTCAMFGVTAKIKTWADFAKSEKQFLLFDFPKNY